MEDAPTTLPRAAWDLLLAVAGLKLALHTASTVFVGYGYSADELYFLDCANRLAWGYVDHPPFSIAALSLIRGALGDSLLVVRLTAALAGAITIVLAGLIARELGGGRVAQGVAALGMLASPAVLFTTGYYSMNAIDLVVWSLAVHLLLRVLNGADPKLWLATGTVIGIGLLNKWSVLWLAGGLAVGLVLSPQRRWLLTPWPWLAGVVALLIWTPSLIWQVQHDWPTLEFMRTGMRDVMAAKPPLEFVREQIRAVNPLLALLGVFGLLHYFGHTGRPYRVLGWIWVFVFVLLMSSGRARPYYLAPAYVIAFAGGAVAVERFAAQRSWRSLPRAVAILVFLAGLVSLPIVVPVLSPEHFVAYERMLGATRVETEFEEGKMPPQFGFQFGWLELTAAVARAYEELPADEKSRAGILAFTFGETAAINFYGPKLGLPRAIGTHNSYWLWGPSPDSGEVMIAVSGSEERLRRWFDDVVRSRPIECEYCMPVLRAKFVYVCRSPRRLLWRAWAELKDYS